jgi:hypothetical protein
LGNGISGMPLVFWKVAMSHFPDCFCCGRRQGESNLQIQILEGDRSGCRVCGLAGGAPALQCESCPRIGAKDAKWA